MAEIGLPKVRIEGEAVRRTMGPTSYVRFVFVWVKILWMRVSILACLSSPLPRSDLRFQKITH